MPTCPGPAPWRGGQHHTAALAVTELWPEACVALCLERRTWTRPHGSTHVALADAGHLTGGRMWISAHPTCYPATLPGPATAEVKCRAAA